MSCVYASRYYTYHKCIPHVAYCMLPAASASPLGAAVPHKLPCRLIGLLRGSCVAAPPLLPLHRLQQNCNGTAALLLRRSFPLHELQRARLRTRVIPQINARRLQFMQRNPHFAPVIALSVAVHAMVRAYPHPHPRITTRTSTVQPAQRSGCGMPALTHPPTAKTPSGIPGRGACLTNYRMPLCSNAGRPACNPRCRRSGFARLRSPACRPDSG